MSRYLQEAASKYMRKYVIPAKHSHEYITSRKCMKRESGALINFRRHALCITFCYATLPRFCRHHQKHIWVVFSLLLLKEIPLLPENFLTDSYPSNKILTNPDTCPHPSCVNTHVFSLRGFDETLYAKSSEHVYAE